MQFDRIMGWVEKKRGDWLFLHFLLVKGFVLTATTDGKHWFGVETFFKVGMNVWIKRNFYGQLTAAF